MKRSLRIRFTLIFTGLTAAILIGIWCVNNWMLESFYVQDKVQTPEVINWTVESRQMQSGC